MSQPITSSLHALSAASIVAAALGMSACSDTSRSPTAPTATLATASSSSQASTSSTTAAPESTETSQGTIKEEVAYNGTVCHLVFTGTPSRTSETLAIWNLGHSILDVPFNTSRPDLYAILPGTMHQEPGYPEYDHDHIASHGPGDPGYNGTWDLWVVTPGQNFNPGTYQAPRSLGAMFALIGSGVLSQPVGMAAAGFGGDIVLHAPMTCR